MPQTKGSSMLHVTNGSSAEGSLRESGLPGCFLSWVDVLHEGPVPADLSPEELRSTRAGFLAQFASRATDEIEAELAVRDQMLSDLASHDEVVLWFEHDLYDQLQLLQILDRIEALDVAPTRLSIVCINSFPSIHPFRGLGQLRPEHFVTLFPMRRPIESAMLAVGRRGWAAFRSPDPTAIEELIRGDTSALPFLASALVRHLEQFPSVQSGLSRTETAVLERLAIGPAEWKSVFLYSNDREEAVFIGDSSLLAYLDRLGAASVPLIRWQGDGPWLDAPSRDGPIEITEAGRAVLAGELDAVHLNGIDRWLGGVHLVGPEAEWRWAPPRRTLVRSDSAERAKPGA
jgi:hypothetical protein